MAVFVQTPKEMMGGQAPGRCADCGSDAYIQLAIEESMLCARCFASRLGLKKSVGRKGGDRDQSAYPRARAN